ncbi:MAG: HNH endonuclease, partial [Lysinibacillus sp.]
MKALLESVVEISDTGKLTFLQVSKHVTKIYWNLAITHQLRQLNSKEKKSSIGQIIENFQLKHSIPTLWNFDRISSEQQFELIKQVNSVFKKYVYGSLYG